MTSPLRLNRRVVGAVQPWPGQPSVAYLMLHDAHRLRLQGSAVREWLRQIDQAGYTSVRTNALPPVVRRDLEAIGFTVTQRLVLLARSLPVEREKLPVPISSWRLSTLRPTHQCGGRLVRRKASPEVLQALSDLDASAFGALWALDAPGIENACRATPRHLVRGLHDSRPNGPLLAYAISGIANSNGYLQRLAVHPDATRRGYGRALVADALGWLGRRGARRVFVNTHVDNAGALALYRSAGFVEQEDDLAVLEHACP